ncbi:MAG: LytTR family transcriptional regulator DNA-binding domain-containing protein [Thermaerobacter sp.]|nr:LytTR family transcriptional regulator DNA-binding domain-containing protein [Thermaerobacter sp.]
MLRALIVDDEPPARAELRYQLERHPDVEVIGEAANVREAQELIRAVEYDVLFLDIQMPSASGLELAQKLHQGRLRPPYVVFVTAHDAHALPAFSLGAVDYLLKPVSKERLAETLERLRHLRGGAQQDLVGTPAPAAPRFLAGVQGDRAVPVPLAEVSYLVAEGDQVFLVTQGRRLQVRATLADLQDTLPDQEFFRCHRGYIVNLNAIAEIVPFFNGTYTLRLKGSREEVPVSRANARRLREHFGLG